MSGPHIKIRSTLRTCEQLPAFKVNVKFPDLLEELWSEISAIDDMPYDSTKTEARVALLRQVRESLLENLKMSNPKIFLDIGRPITSKMTQLQPSLSEEFE